jgi:hypothetical protein
MSYVDQEGANASSSSVCGREIQDGLMRQAINIHTFNLAIRAPSLRKNIVRLSGLTLISQVSMMFLVRERRGKARKKHVLVGMMKLTEMNGTWLALKDR